VSTDETRRLALVKYTLTLGAQHARQPWPLCSVAILLLHDATEFFVQFAAEYLNAKTTKNTDFISYWDAIDAQLSTNRLPKREAMKRMNAARVALKHTGTLPAHREIDGFASMVNEFFAESMPLIFGVPLDSISLTDLIICEAARNQLRQAEQAQRDGNAAAVFQACAVSFDDLVADYEARKHEQFGRSPFFFGRPMVFLSSFFMGVDHLGKNKRLAEFVDTVKECVEAMQGAMKILSLGLDYRKYSRFRLLTPVVLRDIHGTAMFHRVGDNSASQVSPGDMSFCIEFVIESALRLQDFDYDIRSAGA
jgi:hypothetical protein